jgi:predicted deacylase
MLHPAVTLGQSIQKKQSLGFITDAFGDRTSKIDSPYNGIVIGHTNNPLVNQGDGLFHLAVTES